MKKACEIVLALVFCMQVRADDSTPQKQIHPLGSSPFECAHYFIRDVVLVNKYLFTRASMQVLTPFIPLYIGARIIDEPIHCAFYDPAKHENIDEPHKNIVALTEGALILPTIFLSGILWGSSSRDVRIAAGVAIAGMTSALIGKEILKQFSSGRRPYNQHFCRGKNVYNGFPSGHTMWVSFLATYYGLSIGPKALVPLGIFGAFIAGLTIRCNKHYLSQVVAGAGVGVTYAVASHKLFQDRVCWYNQCELECGTDPKKRQWRIGPSFRF